MLLSFTANTLSFELQVGASILTRVLQRLPRSKQAPGGEIPIGLDVPNDAAVIRSAL